MNFLQRLKIKWWVFRQNRGWTKDQFTILEVTNHTREHSNGNYIHTVICKTDKPVCDFHLLSILVSKKVGFDTNAYVHCGLNSIKVFEKTSYEISWNTWDSCD